MSTAILEEKAPVKAAAGPPVVNDFSIHVATANGSGSQSSNNILMRSIFNMGIPVSAKNMFPSNIQGLPTWFTVRANGAGWTARKKHADLVVAMNVESVDDDIAHMRAGDTLVITKSLAAHVKRTDLEVHIVPFDELVVPVCPDTKLRKMVVDHRLDFSALVANLWSHKLWSVEDPGPLLAEFEKNAIFAEALGHVLSSVSS